MLKGHKSRGGFALPTVLIASVVMLTVLATSVSSVVAVRNNLKAQYYEQLAKTAGEAGVAYAKACLAKNGNVPLWTDAKPLTPATDCAGNSVLANNPFSALVVAGGGSGGGSTGGGGGGGGVIENDYFAMNSGNYGVTVGAGGAVPGNQKAGLNGANSVFNGWTAIGGGGGAYSAGGNTGTAGKNGGSGGGGQTYYGPYGPGNGTAGQGYAGGSIAGTPAQSTSGGGGAGGPGLAASASQGSDGGPGVLSTLSGATAYYGGGGGGGAGPSGCGVNGGSGGIGGGGNGGDVGTAGTPNSGGGGGGGWCYASGNGGAGGSGVVIISYPDNGSVTASGGDQVYTSGPNKVHIFKSSGTFTVSSVGTSSCPSDPRCSVVVDDNLRSSFSVGKPALDADGRAVTIPNNGYVELLRASNGQVWRTYRQPSVQAAVVPDLCSGAATSGLGWVPAVTASTQDALPNVSSASTITIANSSLPAGMMYFRKDFVVTAPGTYTLSSITPTSQDDADVYLDGVRIVTAQGALASNSVSVSAGCHTLTIQLTNQALTSRPSRVTAALQQPGSAPIVATDNSWRVSAGQTVHFSTPQYYADSTVWGGVYDYSMATSYVSGWAATTGDAYTHLISAGCTTLCPPSSSTYVRDSRDFVLTANTTAQVSAACDDDCTVYVDGVAVIQSSPWSNIAQQTISLTPGSHRVGARLYNSGTVNNPSDLAITVRNVDTGVVLARTDTRWQVANTWISGTNAGNDPVSYDDTFTPSPQEIATPPTYDVLVVAGGGGGGGNCNTCGGAGGGGGGGTIFQQSVVATTGSRTVTVGTGGSAGVGGASRTNGGNGADSVFGTITAKGGGGGGAQNGVPGNNGGSGGGGSGGGTPAPGVGGSGIAGQGSTGGAGKDAAGSNYNGGGGGGAGGFGMAATQPYAGNGGPGMVLYLTGARLLVGPGGGAGSYSTYPPGTGEDGAGNGASQAINGGTGYNAVANSGGGGGGGNGSSTGKGGGAGGSGIVIVRYKTGSITATGGTITSVTIDGVAYTVHTFTSGTSTFNITSINQ